MAQFKIHTFNPSSGKNGPVYLYDNMTSSFTDLATGDPVLTTKPEKYTPALRVSPDTPLPKTSPRVLKIQLGLSCNYECEYCSQRFVPHADGGHPDKVESFLAGLDSWVKSPPERIEFWGGEPFVYIKTMRPLAEALRVKYPEARFSVVTNGSLLTTELSQWLLDLGFVVSISHDGPGQHVRGPDPLADPATKAAILDLWSKLGPLKRMSFNAMLNKHNPSRAAIQAYFEELLGIPNPPIGEGSVIDAYDEGGAANSFSPEEAVEFRKRSFAELRSGRTASFVNVADKTRGFIDTILTAKPGEAVWQKCGMDRPDQLAVDLNGAAITCQNVSAISRNPAGQGHLMGSTADLGSVKLSAATHWSLRDECPKCPVMQICKGSCMFLSGPLFEASCNNSFADAIPTFCAAVEYLTGNIPMAIEGPQREDRQLLWEYVAPKGKIIPIVPASN